MFNMAASLVKRTKEEKRSVIRFVWSEIVETSDTCVRMLFQYGGSLSARQEFANG